MRHALLGLLFSTSLLLSPGCDRQPSGPPHVTVDELSDFEIDQVHGTDGEVPARWRALDGKPVVLNGEWWRASDDRLDLVGARALRNEHKPPKVQWFVRCQLKGGVAIEPAPGLVDVSGILHVHVEYTDGCLSGIFRLDVDKVDGPVKLGEGLR
jgi:hypothetical protein